MFVVDSQQMIASVRNRIRSANVIGNLRPKPALVTASGGQATVSLNAIFEVATVLVILVMLKSAEMISALSVQ
jgi:hypothetical protein